MNWGWGIEGVVGGGDVVGDGEGDVGGALRQLSQDHDRLSLVRSLYSTIVSPEQALWTQCLPPAHRKA